VATVSFTQNLFGLDDRQRSADVLRECGELGIAFVPFYSIAGKSRDVGTTGAGSSEQIAAVAAAHGASPAQVRLAWTLQQGPHVLAIPGTGDPDHLVENVAAGALRLAEEEMALLNTA
jgi:pyridoxine 4-dehydrogenase